ncbi:hypothetical protein B296_00023866 [Ensete ventricosum]|uniref:Uncharacterized protein n=1 Tax=Ensete ventricosum TaxID=4639 RepID=A0A426ZS72_ENSVE|nr:hypothetical protein B296_00023866 [Ensete ventricosum]
MDALRQDIAFPSPSYLFVVCLGTGHRSPKPAKGTGSDDDPEFEVFRYKSYTQSRHMLCVTGASITSSVLWKRSSFTDSAMLLHLSPMCSGIAPITGLSAHTLHIM